MSDWPLIDDHDPIPLTTVVRHRLLEAWSANKDGYDKASFGALQLALDDLNTELIAHRRRPRRRRHLRAAVRCDAAIMVRKLDADDRPVKGRVLVLGAGGARLELDEPRSIGTVMMVSFTSKPTGEVRCHVVVRQVSDETHVGVEFLDLDSGHREHIDAFVRLTAPYRPGTHSHSALEYS